MEARAEAEPQDQDLKAYQRRQEPLNKRSICGKVAKHGVSKDLRRNLLGKHMMHQATVPMVCTAFLLHVLGNC